MQDNRSWFDTITSCPLIVAHEHDQELGKHALMAYEQECWKRDMFLCYTGSNGEINFAPALRG